MLRRSAKAADRIERKWVDRLHHRFRDINSFVVAEFLDRGRVSERDLYERFVEFFMDQSLDTMGHSLEKAEEGLPRLPSNQSRRMARGEPPQGKIPRSFRDLMRMWDLWRKKKKVPPRQREMAERVTKAYLNRVQSAWSRYGRAFREGALGEDAVTRHIIKATDASFSRAKMITETETTYYYNEVRRKFYDETEAVTHYLFVPLRDAATTKWCNSRRMLVYKKGSRVLEKETPPIHWNCRSELLPLTPANPKHKKLIDDKSRWRENNSPHPLPPGWNGRSRKR